MKILLIEDDLSLCRSLKLSLEQQGFQVTVCSEGEEGLFYLLENAHDLVLLDRMLPGINGMEILRQARAKNCVTPVIFLTALGSLEDRIQGLDNGADDYITKPFEFEELMARIRCICRRPKRLALSEQLTVGDIVYQPEEFLLSKGSQNCTLSRREGELLALFLQNPGQTIPRATIITRVWGPESEIETGNLDNYIHFLRRRLKSLGSCLELKTARGIGYRLADGTADTDR